MLVSKLDEKAELVDITISEEQMDLIRKALSKTQQLSEDLAATRLMVDGVASKHEVTARFNVNAAIRTFF
jgi:hypothetical protein